MQLSIKERIMILNLLPKETNFITLKLIRDLENDLGFSENEINDFEIKTNENSITWDNKKEIELGEKDIKINDKIKEIINKILKKMDEEEKITKDHYSLCEKFL
jgi:hypothetical protein